MTRLFYAEVCPFAHRTRAMMRYLDQPFEGVAVDLSNRPPELLALSPTGKVPLLVDGDLKLYESDIINEYLAQLADWGEAYHQDPGLRARQKLVQKQWDQTVLPLFYGSMKDQSLASPEKLSEVGRELDELWATIQAAGDIGASMLSFHLAPFWLRMGWLREFSPMLEVFDSRPELVAWLDAAAALPAVQATAPDRDATIARYRKRFAS